MTMTTRRTAAYFFSGTTGAGLVPVTGTIFIGAKVGAGAAGGVA
jgi:hypothetical protein